MQSIDKNYFHVEKIYFHVEKIYFHVEKIYFHVVKITFLISLIGLFQVCHRKKLKFFDFQNICAIFARAKRTTTI